MQKPTPRIPKTAKPDGDNAFEFYQVGIVSNNVGGVSQHKKNTNQSY
jgi:hypothetical protein